MKMLIMTYEEIMDYINERGYEPLFDLYMLLEKQYINNKDSNKYNIWIWENRKHIDSHGGAMKEVYNPYKRLITYCPFDRNYIYRD